MHVRNEVETVIYSERLYGGVQQNIKHGGKIILALRRYHGLRTEAATRHFAVVLGRDYTAGTLDWLRAQLI